MNAFKNSTSTFATPLVPTDGIRIAPIDENTERQETSGSSGSSSSLPASTCYTAMTDAQMNLFLERIERGQNRRSPQTTPGIYDILPIVSVKQVPQSEYQQTTTAQSKSFSELKFSNNVSTNRETLKCVKVLLSECGLLSLTDGSRKKPIHSKENIFGYTPGTVRRSYSTITLVPKDDLFKHAHDCKRLFSIMYLIASKDLHYLINQALLEKDGITWYKAIVEHVHGTTNTYIRKAKHVLESLKVYDSKTVKENKRKPSSISTTPSLFL
jgi:hypothetical protein